MDNMLCGQNGTGQMVADKMVRTKWYGRNVTDKMVRTNWYGQKGTDKKVRTKFYAYEMLQRNDRCTKNMGQTETTNSSESNIK